MRDGGQTARPLTMMNRIRIGPKLALMVLLPLLATLVLGAIVWRGASGEIAEAQEDRLIAESVSAATSLPGLLRLETITNGIGGGDLADMPPERAAYLSQLQNVVDDGIERYERAPVNAVLPPELVDRLEAEIAANARLRSRAATGSLTRTEIARDSARQNQVKIDALRWMAEQDVYDPRGSWRLLVVTAPGNERLVSGSAVIFNAVAEGTLSTADARTLREDFASHRSSLELEKLLLPQGVGVDTDLQETSRLNIASLTEQALALEGQNPPTPLTGIELLRTYQLGSAVLAAWTERETALAGDVVARADARITQARARQLVTLGVVVLTILLALGAAAFIGRNILGRLRRVSEHAEQLNAGVIEDARLPARGSDEIAVLASAMNRVTDVYGRLVAQTEALAAGRLDDKALSEPLPGALGGALQGSVDRVAQSSAELLKLATHDNLTGVLDRSGLTRAIEAISSHRGEGAAAVFFVDLDDFKEINDTFGHAAGDEVLIQTARRLQKLARDEDVIARLGGDEFVVLAPNVSDAEVAAGIARRMTDALAVPVPLADGVTEVTASLGWSMAPPGMPLAHAIEAADQAMYGAKRSDGRSMLKADPGDRRITAGGAP